jgi:ABC-2 type transport system ATP-binding protein
MNLHGVERANNAPDATPAILVENLSKWYGPRQALKGLSFSIAPGEVVGLLGPNGSGKTTTLRILTGYLRPTSGRALVGGVDALEDPAGLRAQIGYVPEDIPLYNNMRVAEFLRFMAQLKGLSPTAAARAVEEVSERLELRSYIDVLIGKLSRGYRQRVALAQALVSDPRVLIMDEPTNGLDPYQIISTRELVRSLAGVKTVLIASHILAEMQKMADRVMILLEGKLLAAHPLARNALPQRIRVGVAGPPGPVRALLAGVAGVRSVECQPGNQNDTATYVIAGEPGREALAARIACAVIDHGFALTELTDISSDLEEVFLSLTKPQLEASR